MNQSLSQGTNIKSTIYPWANITIYAYLEASRRSKKGGSTQQWLLICDQGFILNLKHSVLISTLYWIQSVVPYYIFSSFYFRKLRKASSDGSEASSLMETHLFHATGVFSNTLSILSSRYDVAGSPKIFWLSFWYEMELVADIVNVFQRSEGLLWLR